MGGAHHPGGRGESEGDAGARSAGPPRPLHLRACYAEIDQLHEYCEIMGSVAGMEALICNAGRTAAAVSAAARESPPVAVALDEWNNVYNLGDGARNREGVSIKMSSAIIPRCSLGGFGPERSAALLPVGADRQPRSVGQCAGADLYTPSGLLPHSISWLEFELES